MLHRRPSAGVTIQPMLPRLLLAVLIVANLGYWMWSRGDDPAAQEREPHRLQQQVRPEVLQLGRPGAPDAPPPAPAPPAPTPPAQAAPAEPAETP